LVPEPVQVPAWEYRWEQVLALACRLVPEPVPARAWEYRWEPVPESVYT
jgi:hypothetical protein